jgi:hypothetical protein
MPLSHSELIQTRSALLRLEAYVRKHDYRGYDPYDVLLSPIPFRSFGKWPPILAIQIFKQNPFNLRKLIGVPRQWNPKALGLFLHAYSLLPPNDDNRQRCEWLFQKLLALRTPNVPGLAWGYPFPWASPEKYLPSWSPTSVVSAFVAQGIHAWYRTYRDPRALQALGDVCTFITSALHHTPISGASVAISYSTLKPDFCYNASLLAAETYARNYSHTRDESLRQMATAALHAVLSRQKSDGSWNYSEDLHSGRQRVQIDFHQGFVLDSIMMIARCLELSDATVENALQQGFHFYRTRQFTPEGRALWRVPAEFPADIHHQAQGIITSMRYHRHSGNEEALHMARQVLRYTLAHFQAPDGSFYYRKHRHFTDRTPYMRWANAWIMLAMAEALCDT